MHGATPREAHADGRDLARVGSLGVDPHPGVLPQAPAAGQAQVGQRVDQELFDGAHVGDGVGHAAGAAVLGRQGEDRVADELARSVVGDVTTPVGAGQLGTDRTRRHQHVAEVGPHAQGVDGWVLEEQQVVVGALLEQAALQVERLAVRNPAQPADVEAHR